MANCFVSEQLKHSLLSVHYLLEQFKEHLLKYLYKCWIVWWTSKQAICLSILIRTKRVKNFVSCIEITRPLCEYAKFSKIMDHILYFPPHRDHLVFPWLRSRTRIEFYCFWFSFVTIRKLLSYFIFKVLLVKII